MPDLRCAAETCAYNEKHLCCLDDIHVSGEHAKKEEETCCSSFRESAGEHNKAGDCCGCERIAIDCSARDCTYNKDEICHAESVDIHGRKAVTSRETSCGTFRCR